MRVEFVRAVGLGALVVAVALSTADPVAAQSFDQAPSPLPQLKQLTIEELLNVDVTLPSRQPVRVMEAAAAVSVLTNEDIWRSGATTIPEALRSAPALFVGRPSAASWVITARGFAAATTNKMLVMMDGRSLYSPLFSGVFWEQVDYVLADIERIEIVHGPGATLWGSNAVNGAINVVSRSARDTQGTHATAVTGAEEHLHAEVRHGGRVGNGYYRVYGKFANRDDAHVVDGAAAHDWQRIGRGGARFDLGAPESAVTVQGEVFQSRVGQAAGEQLESGGGNLLARWSRQLSATNTLQLQAYYDRTTRLLPTRFEEARDTVDIDYQQRVTLGGRHALSWGAGYRASHDDTTPTAFVSFLPEDRTTSLRGAFMQDEWSLPGDVLVIGGVRLDHNDYTGIEAQPVVRARWMPDTTQNIWGGISRAVRLPTRLDADVRVLSGSTLAIAGNPDFRSEEVTAYELGYRANPLDVFSADISLFRNSYRNLRTQEAPAMPGAPVTLGNGLRAITAGFELAVRVMPVTWMRFTSSYAYLTKDTSLDPTSRDLARGQTEAIDPRRLWSLQARVDLPRRTELDASLRRISALPVPGVPAYTEAALRFAWRPTPALELSVVGRDLLHAQHVEFGASATMPRIALERAVFTRVSVAF